MKNLYSVVIVLVLIGVFSLQGTHQHRFIENYSVEPEIATILDKHSNELYHKLKKIHTSSKQKHGVWQFDWLPGYYVKYGLARIEGMEKMNRCIEKNNLDLLTVPHKKIYHLKGRPTSLSNINYCVIVKEIQARTDQYPLSLEHVQQLCTIIHETNYVSMTGGNFIPLEDGRLCLIDTEATFDRSKLIKGFLRLIGPRRDLNSFYTKDALKHLFWEVKQHLKKHPELRDSVLDQIHRHINQQKKPLAWDYASYYTQYFYE